MTKIANPGTNRIIAEDLLYDPVTEKLTLGGTIEPKNGNNSFLWTYTVDVNNTNFPRETVVKEPGASLQFAKIRKLPGDEMLMAAGITASMGATSREPTSSANSTMGSSRVKPSTSSAWQTSSAVCR